MAFDVDDYVRRGGRLKWDDLGLREAFTAAPLADGILRCLQYMHDIESHTICYLRDTLVTSAHADPSVTTFLTAWNYEEHWHGEAIGEVLAAHGRPSGRQRVADVRRGLSRKDRWRPLSFMIGSALLPDMVAVHMVWGAINEFTTQAGYGLLARKAGHPVLGELLRRIMRQEGLHIDFYVSEGARRLGASRATQRLVRMALNRFWRPVGHGVRPPEETDFVISYLFGSDEGTAAAARIDRRIAKLPGLSGLQLVQRAATGALAA
jgi:hypothetical protein